MKKKNLFIFYGILFAVLIFVSSNFVSSSKATLTAVKLGSDDDLVLDGKDDDAIWATATSLTIAVKDGTNPGDIILKAVYSDTYLYVYVTWTDDTLSITRGSGSWNWNGTGWEHPLSSGSEDRLAIMWNINVTDFEADGGVTKCHGDYAYLSNEGEVADMWHMKSARDLGSTSLTQSGTPTYNEEYEATAGTFTFVGNADDKHVEYRETASNGRTGDAGTGPDSNNKNGVGDAPSYMESNPDDWADAMVLTQAEIDASEAFNVSAADTATIDAAWAIYESFGAIVPRHIIKPPTGSYADVNQAAVWSDGTWTTEFKRKLDTTHDDDVTFVEFGTVLFTVALMDNAGGGSDHSIHTGSYSLVLGTEPAAAIPGFPISIVLFFSAIGIYLVIRRKVKK